MTQSATVQSIYTRSSRSQLHADRYSCNIQAYNTRTASKNSRRSSYIRQIRKWFFVIATIFILITGVLIGSSVVKASNLMAGPKYEKAKCYTSIRVNANETLWEIADQYMTEDYISKQVYISEIKKINHLVDDTIYTGQHLSIPYYEYIELQ